MPTEKAAERSTSRKGKATSGFSAEERAAMRERAREVKAQASKADAQAAALAKIAEMPAADRAIAERLHAVITTAAPVLSATTWYGMPAYAKDRKNVCFFQSADKFKSRYAMLGFTDAANLDDGAMWPTYFALKELNSKSEAAIRSLVKKAVR